eukprot:Gregarina_sp_Poly_1__4786@NODE_2551_length_1994_cov_829_254281_g1620_i0_p2_GENE_NODE_2551_length_1994_cov_829_254281_g1620_i0NODE_2551_length_1994_cov_829_254281_g1620_i0_p2_ORF_typecomplete_len144_score11_01TraE/PF05309_11/0_12_NODE_2551_length_1994_cov_829_254281_g1620_i014311862
MEEAQVVCASDGTTVTIAEKPNQEFSHNEPLLLFCPTTHNLIFLHEASSRGFLAVLHFFTSVPRMLIVCFQDFQSRTNFLVRDTQMLVSFLRGRATNFVIRLSPCSFLECRKANLLPPTCSANMWISGKGFDASVKRMRPWRL